MHVWVHSIEKVSTSVSPRMGPAHDYKGLKKKLRGEWGCEKGSKWVSMFVASNLVVAGALVVAVG